MSLRVSIRQFLQPGDSNFFTVKDMTLGDLPTAQVYGGGLAITTAVDWKFRSLLADVAF